MVPFKHEVCCAPVTKVFGFRESPFPPAPELAVPCFPNKTMAMSRALRPVALVLALGLVSATPGIPDGFFDAQQQQQQQQLGKGYIGAVGAEMEASFRTHVAEYGLTFSTKGEYQRRLRIYAANRYRVAEAVARERGRERTMVVFS